jgi:putative membrane protein (TIGR04086 family)
VGKLSFKGIVAGVLVCGVSAAVFAALLLLFASHTVPVPAGIVLAVLVVGNGVASLLGGYVAARLAGHDEVLNGLLAVLLPVIVGLARLGPHEWKIASVALLLIYPMGGILGGYLSRTQHLAG